MRAHCAHVCQCVAEAAIGVLLVEGRARMDVVEEFARGQNLVTLLESVLRKQVEMAEEDRDASWALARFLVERKRAGEALEVVETFAGGDAGRLREGSELMMVLDRRKEKKCGTSSLDGGLGNRFVGR